MYLNFKHALLACLALFLIANTGCKKDEDVEGCTDPNSTNYNPEATIDDGSCQYGQGPGQITANTDTLTSDISTGTTLSNNANGVDYFICGSIDVSAGLTIEPGTSIIMCSNAEMRITQSGFINAVGTADQPIYIAGETPTPGYWNHIEVESTNPNNIMRHVNLSHGGGDNSFANSTIWIQNFYTDASLEMQNCVISDSKGYGLFVENSCELTNFQTNTFTANGSAPIRIPTDEMGSLDAGSTYDDGNVDNFVVVGSFDVNQDMSVTDIGVPFFISGAPDFTSDVIFQAGVEILMNASAEIRVTETGSFNCQGTADNPISFSAEVQTPGYWNHIEIESNNPLNKFTHTEFAYGGGDASFYNSTVWLQNFYANATAEFQNCTFRQSEGYGLFVENRCELKNFQTNTFSNNGSAGLRIPTQEMGSVDAASTYNDGNSNNYIQVSESAVNQNMTVVPTNAPFHITGDPDFNADVTFEPGVDVRMGAGAEIRVTENGSFNAVGNASNPIIIKGLVATVGYWNNIEFESNNPLNNFEYVEIAHGGGSGLNNSTLFLQNFYANATLRIYNCTVSDSYGYGLYVENNCTADPNTASGVLANNTFSNNATGANFSCTVSNCDAYFE